MRPLLQQRNSTLQRISQPLPGSEPYDNLRPINIPARLDGRTLIECVVCLYPHLGREQWEAWFRLGHILHEGHVARPSRIVRGGEQFWHCFPDTVEPDVDANVRVTWEDESLVAVIKPAPLPVHPCGRFNRNTLTSLLDAVYGPGQLRLVHRLDANTTGVMVLAKSKASATHLRQQFEANRTRKRYLVRILGQPDHDRFRCEAKISRERADAGVRTIADDGLEAATEFRILRRFSDGSSLAEALPLTGRTNQIRIHLWSLRMPVMGDPSYLPEQKIAARQTLTPQCPSMCLHAWSLSLLHPDSAQPLTLTAEPPAWAKAGEASNA